MSVERRRRRELTRIGALLAVLCGALAGPPASAEKPDRELPAAAVFGRVAASIVVIEVAHKDGHAQGSGVVIAPSLIVTNHHVVEGGGGVQVRQGARSWPGTIEALDPKHDLALVRVKDLDLPRVAMRPSSLLSVGERVYAVGAPRGLELSLSDGLIAALRREKSARKESSPASAKGDKVAKADAGDSADESAAAVIQTTAPVSPGSSGGGLFDAQARLVGIITFSSTGGQNLNFAHPTEWVEALRAPSSTVAAGKSAAPAPRYGLTQRPWGLSCHVDTRATWGIFSGGAELLESKPVDAKVGFIDFDGQTPSWSGALDSEPGTGDLVLADLNRQAGFILFSRVDAKEGGSQYFFSVDDDARFRLTVVTPFDFHGQLRVRASSGGCEPRDRPKKELPQGVASEAACKMGDATACVAAGAAIEKTNRASALSLYLKGCDQLRPKDPTSRTPVSMACIEAARLCDAMGFESRAADLRKRAAEITAQ